MDADNKHFSDLQVGHGQHWLGTQEKGMLVLGYEGSKSLMHQPSAKERLQVPLPAASKDPLQQDDL